jgi:ClpP class serine protease
MPGNAALLASRYARRPLLLEPNAAQAILRHIALGDPRGMASEGRIEAFMRRLTGGRARPMAMEDDEGSGETAPQRPAAYAPLWAQQTYGEPADEGFAWCLFEGIATMEVSTALAERGEYYCGVWYHGYDTVLAGLREAIADERVKAVFIRMASPGGPVSGGLPALAAFMRQARAAAGGKPIHIYADMACSAAYWISAQADRIVAPDVGLIGSIGAVLVHEDWSQALAKAGVVITPIQFGAEKTAGAWWEALSASARADLQAEIDQCGRNFVADVAAGRPKLTPEALIATQARVFLGDHDETARSALDIGFADAIMSEEDAFGDLLASLSSTHSAPRSAQTTIAAESGRETGDQQPKEPAMAAVQPPKGPKAAQTPARRAAAPGKDPEDMQDGGADDADETEDAADGGADEADEGEPDETGKKEPSAAAIAASKEAKSHPHLALAAIQSGQTLAQFRANVAAAGEAPRASKLDGAMAGAHRLGPDAAAQPANRKSIDARALYKARNTPGRRI